MKGSASLRRDCQTEGHVARLGEDTATPFDGETTQTATCYGEVAATVFGRLS
jgi:hypothetical protein